MPLYESIRTDQHDLSFARDLFESSVKIGDRDVVFNVWYGKLAPSNAEIYFVDCPQYYHRPGVYTSDADEDERFILLQHAAFHIMQRYHWAPDVVHANDWPTALMPAMLTERYGWDDLFRNTASVLSIHNIAYQGTFHRSGIFKAGLSYSGSSPGGPLEYHGGFSFLKAGVAFADMVSTVSPTYAREIQTPEYGIGMDGILRTRAGDLFGILNGIDTVAWNPASDPHIAQTYDVDSIDRKEANKIVLADECGLPFWRHVPLVGIVSRLATQKGLALLYPILAPLLESEAIQLVVLGSGERDQEAFFRHAAAHYPDRVHARIGFDEPFAHRIEAGADVFLMPSLYEPCGLNQMYSLRYGTVPVVRKTGGLADTVIDQDESGGQGNGFSFYDFTAEALLATLLRAIATYHVPHTWRGIQQRGMVQDFSWSASAARYVELYQTAISRRKP
jgi:starch synthase